MAFWFLASTLLATVHGAALALSDLDPDEAHAMASAHGHTCLMAGQSSAAPEHVESGDVRSVCLASCMALASGALPSVLIVDQTVLIDEFQALASARQVTLNHTPPVRPPRP